MIIIRKVDFKNAITVKKLKIILMTSAKENPWKDIEVH
jgi:hypothetical protein